MGLPPPASPTTEDVLRVLREVRYPGFSRDVVSFGIVKDLRVDSGEVRVRLELGPGNPAVAGTLERDVRRAIESLAGVRTVSVHVGAAPAAAAGPGPFPGPGRLPGGALMPGVRHVVAVASGKGGVGKSTVAVNLAVALAKSGARAGLLDADIYGPSIPLMLRPEETPRIDAGADKPLGPALVSHGVRFMSIGFLVPAESALVWRGPLVIKALEQLMGDVDWGELDVLVVDLPPGTGDVALTLSQKVRLAGVVVVTTPQDVALADAVKAVTMFRKVEVPILGIVENMSVFTCGHCGHRTEIFGHGGGRRWADRMGVPLLGEIEIDPALRDGGDRGLPIVVADPSSPRTLAFLEVARKVLEAVERPPGEAPPPIA